MRLLRSPGNGLALLAFGGLIAIGGANAQDWPVKPTRVITSFGPGGPDDVFARLIAKRLGEKLGQTFMVENRAGASGNIGTNAVAKSAPDGYTLGFLTSGPLANNRFLYKSMPFDASKDLDPIILIGEIPLLAVANPAVQARNLKELAELARARPGQINAGSSGSGAMNHLTLELFKAIAKVDLVHVPFKGPPTADLLAGNIQISFAPITGYINYVQTGTLRALAVIARTRFPALPDVPTAIEQGFDMEASLYFALVGPAGVPRAVVNRLNQEVNQYLSLTEGRAKLAEFGAQVIGGPPERVASMIESESKKWKRIIESSGARLD